MNASDEKLKKCLIRAMELEDKVMKEALQNSELHIFSTEHRRRIEEAMKRSFSQYNV